MLTDTLQNMKQKLKMIILTSPGEKLMDPEFGIGIRKYLFEPSSGILNVENGQLSTSQFQSTIFQELSNQVYRYSPDITIQNVIVEIEEYILKLTIEYNYRSFISDSLTITLGAQ